MALKVEFPLEQALQDALADLKSNEKQRAVVAVIKDEVLKLHSSPVPLTDNLANDLAATRKTVAAGTNEACFIVVRIENRGFVQVILVPETVKPAIRMVYASSATHLRAESHLAIPNDTHITKLDELVAALFDVEAEEDKELLMTESEKASKEIADMVKEDLKTAPKKAPLAGVAMPLDEQANDAADRFVDGKCSALVFTVGAKNIHLEKEFPTGTSKSDVVAALPEAEPRFVLINWEAGKDVLAYICPVACKPKLKMGYSSSKGAFVAQLNHKDIRLAKSVEMDAPSEMEEQVTEALNAPQVDEVKEIKAKPVPKGFRMPTA